MKSHEHKMQEKAEHEAELQRNDLNDWLRKAWQRLKSGELITRKFALVALAIGVMIGLIVYFLTRRSSQYDTWKEVENAATVDDFDKISNAAPDSTAGKVARMQKARLLMSPATLSDLTDVLDAAKRNKAIDNIVEARGIFEGLVNAFEKDLTMQCQALEAAAQSELALVGIRKDGVGEPRGSVDRAIEHYRRYAKVAGETAGAPAKAIADELEKRKDNVEKLGEYLTRRLYAPPPPKIEAPTNLNPAAGTTTPPK